MSNVSLTVQLGAMQYVDDIRHARSAVDDQLDMPKRRLEVANRIAEYYAAQQISVTPDAIESGVRAYFDRRLSFEAPKVGTLAALVATVYVTRGQWGRKLALVSATAAAVAFAGVYAHNRYEVWATKRVADFGLVEADRKRLIESEFQRIKREADRIQRELSAQGGVNSSSFIAPLQKEVVRGEQVAAQVSIPAVTAANRDQFEANLHKLGGLLAEAESAQANAQNLLREFTVVADSKKTFDRLVSGADYQAAEGSMPALATQASRARSEFLGVVPGKIFLVTRAVEALDASYSAVPLVRSDSQELKKLEGRFESFGMNQVDRERVHAVVLKGQGAVAALDHRAASASVEKLSQLADYGAAHLTMRVVDRSGVKSGVERNYNPTGGKSWYLVVEAVDAAGSVVNVPVRSSETGGDVQFRPYFGVRVSHELYEMVKSEKKQTGHVSHKNMGEKPANALAIKYANAFSEQPETIMEW